MKMKNVNLKKLIPFIVIVCVIIVVIVVAINSGKDKDENDGDFTLGGVSPYKAQENLVSDENTVYQKDIITNEEALYVDGTEIPEIDLDSVKQQITDKFMSMTKEELDISFELTDVKLFFNQGSTNVYGNNCIVFSVYVQEGEYLKNKATFAMTSDTNILYKYDSSVMAYKLITK